MLRDIRQGYRLLVHSPGFTAVACLTLALGIGANTAIFGVIDAAILRPLPHKDSDRLVEVVSVIRKGATDEVRTRGMSADRRSALREAKDIFEELAAYDSARLISTRGADPSEGRRIGTLTAGFMEFFGIVPQLGRSFTGEDEVAGDRIILSDEFWSKAFGRDRNVLGKTIDLGGRSYRVIGVAPPAFRYLVSGVPPTDAWLPTSERRASYTVARLRKGVDLARAQRALDVLASRLPLDSGETLLGATGSAPTLEIERIDARRGNGLSRELLLSFFGAATFVLLIACSNVASLVLSRTLTRRAEMAVRTSLGATRFVLMRQLLVEGAMLGSLGGAAATLIAWWSLAALPSLVPTRLLSSALFGVYTPRLDARALGFVFLASLGAGLFAAGASALHVACSTGEGWLGTSRRLAGTTVSQRRALWAFQAMQVAMTLVVLMGAALMANSLARMAWTDPGFPIDSLTYFDVGLASSHYPLRSQQDQLYEAVLTRVRSVPGVRGATIGNPPTGGQGGTFIAEGQPVGSNRGDLAIHYVRPDYFSVVGIPLRTGRLLGSADTEDSGVGLVDEVTAKQRFGGGYAIGQRFRYSSDGPWITVVGVVGKVKTRKFTDTNNGEIYLPAVKHAPAPDRTLVVRLDGDTSAGSKVVRSAIAAMDPNITVGQMGAVADYYADVFGPPRFSLLLMTVFAVLATLTATVGLYGVLSCAVSQRTRQQQEIAGHPDRAWCRHLRSYGGWFWPKPSRRCSIVASQQESGCGSSCSGRVVTIELYQITPYDELTFAIVILCLLALGACAAFLPVLARHPR